VPNIFDNITDKTRLGLAELRESHSGFAALIRETSTVEGSGQCV